ncbi:MAG: M28 family peptidase [Acidobacteriota bacterium]
MRRLGALVVAVSVTLAACAAAARQPAAFDSSRAWEHLRAQVGIGPRVAGTPASAKTREYLIRTLGASGITAVEQPFEARAPHGPVRMANVIATLPGRRTERIALASHFDTKLFREFRFVGANDGASSTAVLLELARVLKDRPRTFTLEFIFFDGEEAFVEWGPADGTYGSRFYVAHARETGTLASLKALILLDMVGDRDLAFRREGNSTPWLTDLIWTAARRTGHGRHFLAETTFIEDDHLPFLRAGVPATDIIDLDYGPWHTAGDTLEAVSARSLQVTGEVVLAALPDIEARLAR